MLRTLTLLLVAQVFAEWVEISQHHYRKPIRTHSSFTTADRVQVEETTKAWSYNNHSLTEYNWNKSPANTNIGNRKRTQLVGTTIQTTEKVIYEDDNPDLDDDIKDELALANNGPTRPNMEYNEHGKQKGIIVKVPNLGNIKRVQLGNSPVKSPVINLKGDNKKISNNRYKTTTQEYDMQTEVNEFQYNQKPANNNRRIYVNTVKQHGTEGTATFPPNDDEDSSHFAEQVTTFYKKGSKQDYNNRTAVKNLYSNKSTFKSDPEDYKDHETQLNRFHKITNIKSPEVVDKINTFATEISNIEEVSTKNYIQSSKLATENITTSHDLNKNMDFETESYENNVHHSANGDKQTNFFTNDLNTSAKANIASPEQEAQFENHHKIENKDKKGDTTKGAQPEFNKVKTLENIIKFARVVADTISKNSRRGFGGKMQYLHELKDSILANIEERIDSTWPDDDNAGSRRQSRSAHASPRGHVQFPSSESALMTISFLTFAVFLIKLVLQVIQTYKHKAMMVAPLMVASSGRNIFGQRDHGHH